MVTNNIINSHSVVLVSGGGRGITAQCIIYLAQQYGCKFILLGRSEILETEPEWSQGCTIEADLKKRIMQHLIAQKDKPTPIKVQKIYKQLCQSREVHHTLSEIEKAEYCSVDITDSLALKTSLKPIIERLGKVTGIIHGAGTLADKFIENKTEQDFYRVYDVKVEGFNSLLTNIDIPELKFIVLFSSFVSFYGNAGQSDYSLANEILNKYAYLLRQQHPHCKVVSIGWGPWDGGMVTPQLKELFEQQNIKVIPQQVGAQMLAEELAQTQSNAAQIIIMSKPISPAAKIVTTEKNSYRLYRRLTLTSNPFVYDHVIGGNAVLPAMCALAWIANSCEQLHPGYRFSTCDNYKVLKGIIFDKELANLYCLDLTEVEKSEEEITFECLIWSETPKGIPLYHYRTVIKLAKDLKTTQTVSFEGMNIPQTSLDLRPYEDGTLFHKPRFQGIKEILELDDQQALFTCNLSNISIIDQGQFFTQSFNPYTADMLFQCLLIWVRKVYNSGSLPLNLLSLKQFNSLPFNQDFFIKMSIDEHSTTKVVASAIAYNPQGQVYLEANRMQVTPSNRLNSLFLNNTVASNDTICL
ncbi:SDR family NAD(P)-dependent oxidoreductase [Crocosphaera sp. Alani8]|uniref:SDR family NAD(P)-dependent oxidoreductase n=1 Tax=Crocosphaera sp. Alani8 TaxID=3038952 RepID=UPI00313ADBCC